MAFSEVVGLQHVKEQLVDLVHHNRLSHALLFLGRDGSGALPLALAFAQYIICEKVQQSRQNAGSSLFGEAEEAPVRVDTCGECSACLKASKYAHPDIHYSYPVIPKKSGDKPVSTDYITEWREFLENNPYGNAYEWLQYIGAENKQGNITAEECNAIIHKLSLKSFESEYKVLIMWMPEYLSKEGNKLLKLIEEPPANTLFILVAENVDAILPTILSRCQLVRIPKPETAEIEAALLEKGIDAQKATLAAGVADGNFREALTLAKEESSNDWQALLRDWLNAMLKGGPVAQVKWIDHISKEGRESQKQFLYYFNHLLEQSIRLRVLGASFTIADLERDFAERLNKMVDISQQEAIAQELDKAAYYVERNANPKMLFHALTIKLSHIIKDKALILAN
ncbi:MULTISPECIES: DNA polymerase III subunit [Chitinophagaceae]